MEADEQADRRLPNLLYVGDVPVEKSFHGSMLVYRLFETYPAMKLSVVEGFLGSSEPARRLQQVSYTSLANRWSRVLHTRFNAIARAWLAISARSRAARVAKLIGGFRPDAVVTVGHGFSWLTAAEYANRNRLPLHLIVHDDWPALGSGGGRHSRWVATQFANVYRQAARRFIVSPGMNDEYEARYGVRGDVLYPSQAAGARFRRRAPVPEDGAPGFVIAFAGTLGPQGYVDALRAVAQSAARLGGRLRLYGPFTEDQLRSRGLDVSGIEFRGLVPSEALLDTLASEADILLLPMSFDAEDASNMRLAFPSKLTEYTLTDLPILVVGPEYCSAVHWARSHGLATAVVISLDAAAIERGLREILDRKQEIGHEARRRDTEDNMFSHARMFRTFVEGVS